MAAAAKPAGKVVVTQDPLNVFRFENEWNASFFTCCEDIKLSLNFDGIIAIKNKKFLY